MLTIAIKVLLAVCACAVAIIGVLDLKSLREEAVESPVWSRLTRWGWTKIGLAALTLTLIGVNEFLVYQNARQSALNAANREADLNDQIKSLQSTLRIENLELDAPISHGIVYFNLEYPPEEEPSGFVGIIPFTGEVGYIGGIWFSVSDIFNYNFLFYEDSDKIRVESYSDYQLLDSGTIKPGSEPWYASAGPSPVNEGDDWPSYPGVWFVELTAPVYMQGFEITSSRNARQIFATLDYSSVGRLELSSSKFSSDTIEQIYQRLKTSYPTIKLFINVRNQNNLDNCPNVLLFHLEFDGYQLDEPNAAWIVPLKIANTAIDACDEAPF